MIHMKRMKDMKKKNNSFILFEFFMINKCPSTKPPEGKN
jgi:hypothetical protein